MIYSGKWSIAKVNRALIPFELWNGTSFLDYKTILQEHTTPLFYREAEISPELTILPLKTTVPKLYLSAQLDYIGNKAYTLSTKLYDHKSNNLFGSSFNRLVFVKRGTSTAVQIPEWWRNKLSDGATGKELPISPPVQLPQDSDCTHIFETLISWNDIGYNYYVDHYNYLPICLDGIMDAVVKNKLKVLQDDILHYPVKRCDFTYKKLGMGGDRLQLLIKENFSNPYLLNMALSSQNGVLAQINIEFGESLS